MKWDFRHHLLVQIEVLRCDISHEEFSKRLGDRTERCLARYVAGKAHLQECEFKLIAKALSIDAQLSREPGRLLSVCVCQAPMSSAGWSVEPIVAGANMRASRVSRPALLLWPSFEPDTPTGFP
jgi:hypothetical protein